MTDTVVFARNDPERYTEDSDSNTVVQSDDTELIDAEDAALYANAVVPLTDDPSIPACTLRAVVLGILFGFIVGTINAVFSFRTNTISIPNGFAILVSLPIGIFLSKILPKNNLLNPGPFSIKEHIVVYIIANAASGAPYGLDNVVVQKFYMNQEGATFWPSLFFVLATQLMGYGLSGIMRRFLVHPPAMFWPSNMPDIALFRSLHETEDDRLKTKDVGSLSRFGMFWLVLAVIFVWTFVPEYFASSLQLVSLVCLMSKSNLASMLGSANTFEGFGVLSFTLDWATIDDAGALYTPFYATLVNLSGYMFFYWILGPIFQSTNPFGQPFLTNSYGLLYRDNSSFPAINEPSLFARNGSSFRAKDILIYPDLVLNETAYNDIKPMYLSYMFAIDHLSSFLVLGAIISHVALWYGKDIYRQIKEAFQQIKSSEKDVHAQLMKAYPDVPDWVYLVFTVVMLILQIFICEFTVYKLRWWGVIFAFALSCVYLIPVGIIRALTGQRVSLKVLTELIMGFIAPGQFVAVTTFNSIAINTMQQALFLTGALKLGHYLHINPVHLVACQLLGTVIGAVTNTAAAFYVISAFGDLLLKSPEWNLITYTTFLNTSAIWGAIGPVRFFGPDSPYRVLLWGLLIGFVAPFLPWLANKYYPSKYWHYINFPLFFFIANTGNNNSWILSGLIIAFVFQYYIFNYHYDWWAKYTYCISSALDTGANFAVVVVSILVVNKVIFPESAINPKMTFDPYCFSPFLQSALAALTSSSGNAGGPAPQVPSPMPIDPDG